VSSRSSLSLLGAIDVAKAGSSEDLLEPKDRLTLGNDLYAYRLQIITTLAQIFGGTVLLIGSIRSTSSTDLLCTL